MRGGGAPGTTATARELELGAHRCRQGCLRSDGARCAGGSARAAANRSVGTLARRRDEPRMGRTGYRGVIWLCALMLLAAGRARSGQAPATPPSPAVTLDLRGESVPQ